MQAANLLDGQTGFISEEAGEERLRLQSEFLH